MSGPVEEYALRVSFASFAGFICWLIFALNCCSNVLRLEAKTGSVTIESPVEANDPLEIEQACVGNCKTVDVVESRCPEQVDRRKLHLTVLDLEVGKE